MNATAVLPPLKIKYLQHAHTYTHTHAHTQTYTQAHTHIHTQPPTHTHTQAVLDPKQILSISFHIFRVRSVLDRTLHNPTYDANDGARQQHTDNININTKNHPSMQSNSLLGHEYETIDSRITPRNRQRNQQRQQDTGISGSQEVSHDLQVTASSGQYEVCNTSYAIPEPNQNNNGHSDIDPSRYEVSEAYINAAGNTGHTITDELDNATGPELDADGYAHLEH